MTKAVFSSIIKDINAIEKHDLPAIEELIRKYPYCQSFFHMQLKKLQLEERDYTYKLPVISACVADREQLFNHIYLSKPTPQATLLKKQVALSKPVNPPKEEVKDKNEIEKKAAEIKTPSSKKAAATKKAVKKDIAEETPIKEATSSAIKGKAAATEKAAVSSKAKKALVSKSDKTPKALPKSTQPSKLKIKNKRLPAKKISSTSSTKLNVVSPSVHVDNSKASFYQLVEQVQFFFNGNSTEK